MIILDIRMPESCSGCDLCFYDDKMNEYKCNIQNNLWWGNPNTLPMDYRPSDCPIIGEYIEDPCSNCQNFDCSGCSFYHVTK